MSFYVHTLNNASLCQRLRIPGLLLWTPWNINDTLCQCLGISMCLYLCQRLGISTLLFHKALILYINVSMLLLSTPRNIYASLCQRLSISTLLYVNISVFQRFYAPTLQYIMSQWLYINASLCKRLVISTLQLDNAGISTLLHICQRLDKSMLLYANTSVYQYTSVCHFMSTPWTTLLYVNASEYRGCCCERLGISTILYVNALVYQCVFIYVNGLEYQHFFFTRP